MEKKEIKKIIDKYHKPFIIKWDRGNGILEAKCGNADLIKENVYVTDFSNNVFCLPYDWVEDFSEIK